MAAAAVAAQCACTPVAPGDGALHGEAFGTTWTVRVAAPARDPEFIRERVEAVLRDVDRSMSGWREDSEVSRLNQEAGAGPFPVSESLAEVVEAALRVSRASGGAFDITVAPLLALFGFGPGGDPDAPPPDPAALEEARSRTGPGTVELVRLDHGGRGILKAPGAALDLSGIAKGYAVDRVAEALRALGHKEHLVEIGGEVRASGSWTVGVEAPLPGLGRRVVRSWRVADVAVATSGGYRDFRETGEPGDEAPRFMTHIFDPRAGRPVERPRGSVTVAADTCLEADAWATALFVLGPEDGLAVAERLGLAALFLLAADVPGTLAERSTTAFSTRVSAPRDGGRPARE